MKPTLSYIFVVFERRQRKEINPSNTRNTVNKYFGQGLCQAMLAAMTIVMTKDM